MSAEILPFAAREGVVLDTTRIALLRRSLGDQRTREVLEEVTFHLSDRLGLLRAALAAGDVAEAQVLAARLASLSEQVGLATFARVARDLAGAAAGPDRNAAAAISARLARLAEESLFSVIHYADHCAL